MPEIEYGLTPYMFSIAKKCKRFDTARDLIIYISEKEHQDFEYVSLRLETGAKESGLNSFEAFFNMAKTATIKQPIKREYPDEFVPRKYKTAAQILGGILVGASIIIAILLFLLIIAS